MGLAGGLQGARRGRIGRLAQSPLPALSNQLRSLSRRAGPHASIFFPKPWSPAERFLPLPAQDACHVVQHTLCDFFSLQTPSSPRSKSQLPTLPVSSLVRQLLVPKPRTPLGDPNTDFLPAPSQLGARQPSRPSTLPRLAPPGRDGVSPAGSKRVPGGPRAAGKRNTEPAGTGAVAAAPNPEEAPEGQEVGGAEHPWPPAL